MSISLDELIICESVFLLSFLGVKIFLLVKFVDDLDVYGPFLKD